MATKKPVAKKVVRKLPSKTKRVTLVSVMPRDDFLRFRLYDPKTDKLIMSFANEKESKWVSQKYADYLGRPLKLVDSKS